MLDDFEEILFKVEGAIWRYIVKAMRRRYKIVLSFDVDELKCLPLDTIADLQEVNRPAPGIEVVIRRDVNTGAILLTWQDAHRNEKECNYLKFLAYCTLLGRLKDVEKTCDKIVEKIKEIVNGTNK